jgi:hypothetical protein
VRFRRFSLQNAASDFDRCVANGIDVLVPFTKASVTILFHDHKHSLEYLQKSLLKHLQIKF